MRAEPASMLKVMIVDEAIDRTVHYVARVGLDNIKQRVVEDGENCKALYGRLRFALQGEPDPWRERAQGTAAREFEMLEA